MPASRRQSVFFTNFDISGIIKRHGAEFKLDVGLYRLDQQVACQRETYLTVFFDIEGL